MKCFKKKNFIMLLLLIILVNQNTFSLHYDGENWVSDLPSTETPETPGNNNPGGGGGGGNGGEGGDGDGDGGGAPADPGNPPTPSVPVKPETPVKITSDDEIQEIDDTITVITDDIEKIDTGSDDESSLEDIIIDCEDDKDTVTTIVDENSTLTLKNTADVEDKGLNVNSAQAGDPVNITDGSYIQNEEDINIGKLMSVSRRYVSNNTITSSFGFGWTTNLDERILIGVDAGIETIVNNYKEYVEALTENIYEYESKLKQYYAVDDLTDIYIKLQERLIECNTYLQKLIQLSVYSNGDIKKYAKNDQLNTIDRINNDIDKSLNILVSKYNDILQKLDTVDLKLSKLSDMNEQLIEAQNLLSYYITKSEKARKIKTANSVALFTGMQQEYEETGFGTLSVIDEYGFPHLLRETYSGSGEWNNPNDKVIKKCERYANGYRVILKNGTIKEYDDKQLITRITDRNENWIKINRNTDEKIESICSSDNENFLVYYDNKFIKKIVNTRDLTENVEYSYKNNQLESVRDIDNDTVVMKYNSNGKLTELIKNDGSSILFIYEKGMVVSTVNEEKKPEYFIFNNNKTTYKDHEGNVTSYEYDKNHRTTKQIAPDGTITENKYNSEGDLESKIIHGNKTEYEYDNNGNISTIKYQKTTGSYYEKFEYDDYGEITRYIDCDGVINDYIRDLKGNIIEYKIGGQTVYKNTYNEKGRLLTRIEYADIGIETAYEYDKFGNIITQRTAGVKTEYRYDNRNRILSVKIDERDIYEYSYSDKCIIRKDYNGLEIAYVYNGRKDLVNIIQKDNMNGKIIETRVEYDRRHLPVKVYAGDGLSRKLIKGYVYTAEGKVSAEISYSDNGKDNYIRVYEYENGEIKEVKQFKVQGVLSEDPASVNIVEAELRAGSNVFIQKYEHEILIENKRRLSVTDGNGITSIFEYDSFGNLVKYTDGNEEISEWIYSGTGRLKKEQASHGGWYEYNYDRSGRLISSGEENSVPAKAEYYPNGALRTATDRYGKVTEYKYDASGNVRSIVTENSTVWYKYDSFGRILSKVIGPQDNENSAVYFLEYEYSDNGRSVAITEGGKYKYISEMDAFGNVIKTTDGNGNETLYEYDFQNNFVGVTDGYGKRISYEYNALGNVSKTTDRNGSVILYSYNEFGQIYEVTDEEGLVYSAEYDKAGRIIREKNRADAERTYEYDKAGRVTRVICGGETVESYSYEDNARIVKVIDGNNKQYEYDYDYYGRLVKETNRMGNIQEYFYDAEGQIKSKNSFERSDTVITYSSDRTVRTTSYADGTQSRLTYNALGLIDAAENEYGKTIYEYDKGGKLIKQTDVTTGEVICFIYDSAGNRTKLLSSNRETAYTYGKNNEVTEVYDIKQRMDIKLEYDVNGRETERKFSNGVSQNTYYDKAGRVILITQKTPENEVSWGEAYLYGADGKRIATADINGAVTLYEYDAKGQLSTVYYPYTKAMEDALKEEAEENRMPAVAECGMNKFLDSSIKNGLSVLLNRISWNYGSRIFAMQLFIKESYKYDGNGNRIQKITPYGTIDYKYNEENFLISSGWNGTTGITYTYDKEGNLLAQESELKSIKYVYNAQNRIMYSEVTDKKEKTYSVSYYGYDAFGRRIIEQDKNEAALYSLYEGFTFDVVKQSPTFANGLFTASNETGIIINMTGKPTGDRYRHLEDSDQQDNNRYFYLDEGTYKTVSSRYKGSRTALTVNGTIAGQNADGEVSYFTTDLLGSVRTTTNSYGYVDKTYSYDAFGAIIEGDLSGRQNYGYIGKQFDKQTGLYNYGYRDYTPKVARFTTVDPIRDGENWLTLCNNDSVNHVDLWGLETTDSDRYTDNIVEYLIPVDNDARSGNNRAKTTGIVIHYTDGARKQGNKEVAQTPKQTIDYWISEQNTSAHFVIGEKGEIYQAIPTEEIAYHAGENKVNKFVPGIQDTLEGHPNTRTIGIEMENNKVSGTFSTQTYNATVQLTAELCMKYGLDPQTSVYMHNDITGKTCPKYFVNNPGAFNQFKNDVEKEMENLGSVGYY